ncbi:hypothetical protein Acr_12g0002420 [Actinidia rufa]|uniref:F-box domain-containing protein n=1 Tax=Actinidia rufa TaxID=165716 RepID=A0A7J0FG91_9ERIC|nr:hypothetical protein Acr_12g0002420 [Actinidia rufa]
MVQLLDLGNVELTLVSDKEKRLKFCINDHMDILIEILQRLDGRSLGAAACVCRQWRHIARSDWLWEHLCFRHISPRTMAGVRPVVAAMGGYRRLYMLCLRPVLSRLGRTRGLGGGDPEVVRRVWTQHLVELSLSLFCVDYYERLGNGGGSGGWVGDASASSLMFLCKPVNV